MEAFKLRTKITKDGKIVLPETFKQLVNTDVEIVLLVEKKENKGEQTLSIPVVKCGGKIKNFTREDLYDRF